VKSPEPYDYEGEMERFTDRCILAVQGLAPGPERGETAFDYRDRVVTEIGRLLFDRLALAGKLDADIIADPNSNAWDVNEALCDLAFTNGVLRRFGENEVLLPRPGKAN
jgi:hypothetical protein